MLTNQPVPYARARGSLRDGENRWIVCSSNILPLTFVYENVQEWTDANMRWNTSEYSDIKDIRLPPARLWKPDILMYNRSVLSTPLHVARHASDI